MTRKRLEELLARYEPRIARKFRQVMQRVKDARSLAELEVALENGTAGQVLADVTNAAGQVAAEGAAVHNLVAAEVAAVLADQLDKLVSYDSTNTRAVQRLARNRLVLSTYLTEEQRQAIGEALIEGASEGINPRRTAIAIRDSIGLDAERTKWVANYRRALERADRHALDYTLRDARSDRAVARAVDAGVPLPKGRIDKLVDRYAARQLQSRAELVAQDQTVQALSEANEEAYAQAIESGHLDEDRIQCTWRQASRATRRESHVPMNGQRRREGVPFLSGNGYALRYPHDPDAPLSERLHCACVKVRRVLPEGESAVNVPPVA